MLVEFTYKRHLLLKITSQQPLEDEASIPQLSAHFVTDWTEPWSSSRPVLSQGREVTKLEPWPSNGSTVNVDKVVSCKKTIKKNVSNDIIPLQHKNSHLETYLALVYPLLKVFNHNKSN